MKLYRRYSETPLLELRTDFGSDRTVAGRPYVWFTELERGNLKRRMKAIPLPIEQATTLLEWSMDFLLVTSGQAGASRHIHEFFQTLGFDVRSKKGKAPRKSVQRKARTGLRVRVTRFLKRIRVWRSRKPATVVL